MNREVYCKDCKYYLNILGFNYPPKKNTGSDVHTVCNCPKNIDRNYPPSDPRKYVSTPSIINRNCNCNWFMKKTKCNTFVWSHEQEIPMRYRPHGNGTFNINPKNGIDGFFIGNKTINEIIDTKINDVVHVQDHEERISKLETITTELNEKVDELNEKIDSTEFGADKIVQVIEDRELHGGTSQIIP